MRIEFSRKIKMLAFHRAGGRCEHCDDFNVRCGIKLYAGNLDFDHVIPAELGGEAILKNCQALCKTHHKLKTKTDQKDIGRARRVQAKHLGIKSPRKIVRWRRFDGSIVIANRER